MSEISRLLFELGAGSLTLLLGIMSQRQRDQAPPDESARREPDASLDAIGLQLDTIDAMIEMQTEPAVRLRRGDEESRTAIRQLLLDIDDLAALVDPPPRGTFDEPIHLGPLEAALAADALFDPESSPTERARVFLSTGDTLDANGGSFWIQIVGNRGSQQLVFASGTTQSYIIEVIQLFRSTTGVVALQDNVDPALVRLTSLHRGARRYVGAGRLGGNIRNAFYDENRANPADRQLDFGA